MLFAFRALFGIGMGGEWAAGMPLALEQWPQHLRGIGSGMLQSGWPVGFILSSFAFQYVYPLFSARPVLGYGDYRMPVRGLYLCGSGSHPGGGVTGVPGHNAAREVLRDLGSRGKL